MILTKEISLSTDEIEVAMEEYIARKIKEIKDIKPSKITWSYVDRGGFVNFATLSYIIDTELHQIK